MALQFVDGIVAFCNLESHDVYQGKTTGNYTLTITLEADAAQALEALGVNVKDYNGTAQRKFKSQYEVPMCDASGEDIDTVDLPYGFKVRVLFKAGKQHPQFGVPVYLSKVKVLELADESAEESVPSDF